MEAPGSLYFHCPECDDFTLHHIIKAKFSTKKNTTLNGTAQCTECEYVHHVELNESKDLTRRLILSTDDQSEKLEITLPGDEEIEVGQEIMYGDDLIRIARLENNERNFNRASVKNIDTIWAKRFNSVTVKVSVSHGPSTYSRKVFATPEEEFGIGEIINFDEYQVVIKKIKDEWGMVKTGFVKAKDITRIYCALIR
jgi:uncharacterized Zn finger protein